MSESSKHSLYLPSRDIEFFLEGPDEKPGYDAFEPMISETSLLEKLNSKCTIKSIDDKNYAQLGVIDAKENSITDTVYSNLQKLNCEEKEKEHAVEKEEAPCVFRSSYNAEDRSKLEQNEKHLSVVDAIQTSSKQIDIFTEYLPLGVSYLEMIKNDQAVESLKYIDFELKKTTLDKKNSYLNPCQSTQNGSEVNSLKHEKNEQQRKEKIEELTRELMLTSELISKPIETPCFGVPHIPLRKPRKSYSNVHQLQQLQSKATPKKLQKLRKNKTGETIFLLDFVKLIKSRRKW